MARCCINQESPETIKAGVDGFSRYLDCSDGMIAFVSLNYFSRIWSRPDYTHAPLQMMPRLRTELPRP